MLEKIVEKGDRPLKAFLATALTLFSLSYPSSLPASPSRPKVVCSLEGIYLGQAKDTQTARQYLKGKCSLVRSKPKPDFVKSLSLAWDTKIELYPANARLLSKAKKRLVSQYRDSPRRTTLEDYVESADRIAKDTFYQLNWPAVQADYGLDRRRAKVLTKAMRKIRGKELIAYALTELMPSFQGERNKQFLDFLLREAGKGYLESLPAFYDRFCSYGPFQFTSYALNGVTNSGASRMNQHLPQERRLPGSMIYLRGEKGHHFRAAYLFAGNNLALLINQLDSQQLAIFSHYLNKGGNSHLVQYIALAHHNPVRARKVAERWLKAGAKKGLDYYCFNKQFREYGRKTKNNYFSLIK